MSRSAEPAVAEQLLEESSLSSSSSTFETSPDKTTLFANNNNNDSNAKQQEEEQQHEEKTEAFQQETNNNKNDNKDESSSAAAPFVEGDHVYHWCKIAGIPAFQHHGIVMGITWDDLDQEWYLSISDFSNLDWQDHDNDNHNQTTTTTTTVNGANLEDNGRNPLPPLHSLPPLSGNFSSNPFSTKKEPGGWRSYASPAKNWNKVRYDAKWWQKIKSPSGTCTSSTCDPPPVVQARVRFLQLHADRLLGDVPYHWLHNNCECVAVWCKTGTWATLQGLSFLATTAASHAKSTAVMASTAAAATTPVTVTAPAAGLWGWLGFTTTTTTQVSLLAAQPWIIPVLATYGVITIGIPAIMIRKAQKEWKTITGRLNEEFWDYAAVDQQDVFVECIQYYWKNNKDNNIGQQYGNLKEKCNKKDSEGSVDKTKQLINNDDDNNHHKIKQINDDSIIEQVNNAPLVEECRA